MSSLSSQTGELIIRWAYDRLAGRVLLPYRKIPITSSGLFLPKLGFFGGLVFVEAYFQRGLLSERVLRFKMGLAWQ